MSTGANQLKDKGTQLEEIAERVRNLEASPLYDYRLRSSNLLSLLPWGVLH